METLLLYLLSFTPFCKLFVGALDVVAAAHKVIGALVVIDAGSGVVVGLSYTALLHTGFGSGIADSRLRV